MGHVSGVGLPIYLPQPQYHRNITMIEKIQIRNFRTHKRLDIEFCPFVNSIIGRNAAGKSTVIRAIKWIVKNKPAGDSIINWNADKASVRLTIDGNRITRTRGKGINIYKINKNEPYKAFGSEVPKEVENIVNLSDINFQGQHEAPFWFCKTAGEVSRQLNSIVNLERIDSTLKNIASFLHKSRTSIEIIEGRLSKILTRQESLAYVEEMDEELKNAEQEYSEYQEINSELALLQNTLKLVLLHRSERNIARGLRRDSKLALSKGQVYQEISIQIEDLSKVLETGKSLLISINKRPPPWNRLEILQTKQEVASNQYNALGGLLQTIEEYEEIKCLKKEELQKLKKDIRKVVGDRCPLCGTKTDRKS